MSNNQQPKKFTNKNLNISLNTYLDNKQNIWFKAKDVATTLGYTNTKDAVLKHVNKKYKTNEKNLIPKGVANHDPLWNAQPNTIWITEPGVYALIFKSKLPIAEQFQDWVFSKVLPSIRKYEIYKIFNTKNQKVFMIQDEFSLHKRVLYFLRNYITNAVFTPVLGELQDTCLKRWRSWERGYTRGEPDIEIKNFQRKYNGFCIELKTPKETGVLSKAQQNRLKHYRENNYLTLVSDNYEEIILKIIKCFRDVRLPCVYCNKRFKSDESRNKHYKFFHKISKKLLQVYNTINTLEKS